MLEYPWKLPLSVSLTEWVSSLQSAWENIKRALAKTKKNQKVQADKRWSPQGPFRVGEKVYLSIKYLKLQLPCKKLGPKYIGTFPIVKVINPVTVESSFSNC